MVLNFTKLNKSTLDPEQIHAGKPAFRLFSNVSRSLQPLEIGEVGTGIMLFIPPTLTVKVFPSEHLIRDGVICPSKVMVEGDEIKLSLLNISIPDFLYLKSGPASAASALFGSHNSVSIEKGDEIATILIEKSLENVSFKEII
jgi:dUTPase